MAEHTMTSTRPATRRAQALSRMRPGGGPDDRQRWQQRKASLTREAILEAAVDSLVDTGYAGLSTNDVARRASVSRGAMHHHFASRADLVEGLIEHVFYHRMRQFLDEFLARLKQAPPGEDPYRMAMELHWRSVQSREYGAFLRLAVAARSDDALAAIFTPAARLYDEIWLGEMHHAFPQWREAPELMRIANDVTQAVHAGVLINGAIWGDERSAAVLERAAMLVEDLAQLAQG
ncbi:TetR/AcrR family transcriptional regulator [Croceicoccus marinus]|uniref:TetR/AcrR family transcriptional regulator n=2 Tax=Croceicoccus marinus TaxID=450378 RepID=A0A7G6W0F3_9SPHN|nr:TetR/AcrR family transcriptional regulator [Croceicoccus marinus]QNE07468.1 TetR/AcrR family transcriptional regulator [Croceicoccus marinus]